MELCGPPRFLPTLPRCRDFAANPSLPLPLPLLLPRPSPALSSRRPLAFRSTRGWRATDPEETSTSVVSKELGTESDEEAPKKVEADSFQVGSTEEEAPSSGDEQSKAAEFLSKLNLKLDSEDTYTIVIYGTGALVALWISSAVVSALDSLPVFPKVMEIVGLAFTIWFSSRYLIFKENRDEFFAKIDDLKEQVLGPSDD
ncbi:protein CURVATURE THYLAKOID 1D, chloroplastic-like [Phoenix dactylifera]|uniref:Protein CURVATURE THYLAKOID 1D, chloroplastic-like n=1 Tax=Phoenix dactylifera TaxID=42345 RepID=A0A8B9AWZ0_PHODC|nr:protein CURVATURE THYLAKOID 1D, chloroplastic-like [Phoenix dactylifera]